MAKDLVELHERIAFCRSEISELQIKEREFLDRAVAYRKTIHQIAMSYDLYVSLNAPIPTSLRSKTGMIANELRSCLDALACQLAIRNGKATGSVYFPASKSKQIFEDDGMKKIAKLSSADQSIIVGLAPYKGGNATLFELHEADRTRKHTRLCACGSQPTVSLGNAIRSTNSNVTIRGGNINGQMVSDFSSNTYGLSLDQVGKESLIATNAPISIPMSVVFNLTYQDPIELAGKQVLASLAKFAHLADSTVQLFD